VLAVDVDLDECAQGDLLDGTVISKAVRERAVDHTLRSGRPVGGEVGLERRSPPAARPGGTSLTRKFSVSIGLRQEADPAMATGTGVTEATPGSPVSFGCGSWLYAMAS
jgi:hypothetical protein